MDPVLFVSVFEREIAHFEIAHFLAGILLVVAAAVVVVVADLCG